MTALLEKLRVHLELEWIYEKETSVLGTGFSQGAELEEEPIVATPKEEIAVLLDIALRGNLIGIASEPLNWRCWISRECRLPPIYVRSLKVLKRNKSENF